MEAKLGDMNFEKLQSDENKLLDFIRDKYERKRYAAKGKDPMALVYEGKDPEVNNEKKHKKESDEEDDKQK